MRLTYHTALVLHALLDGRHHGFDIMDATQLPSGTVYPILRRLNAEGYVRSRWEKDGQARREQRPPRRYYELTSGGTALAREGTSRVRQMASAAARLTPAKAEI
jgi:PadR family transcriptional regulator